MLRSHNSVLTANKIRLCKPTGHKWPESIDFDSRGNLYFTDAGSKALYQIKRDQRSNTLPCEGEKKLLWGFQHLAGISIDRINDHIYLGVKLEENGRVKGKILQIPVDLLDDETGTNYQAMRSGAIREYDLDSGERKPMHPRPNGVVFDPATKNVFYTNEDLLGCRGYVGNIRDSHVRNYETPNGIDIDHVSPTPALIVALSRANRLVRLDAAGHQLTEKNLGNRKKYWLGLGPDGVFCLENGDVLFASFLLGKIYYLRRQGDSFSDPLEIESGLDQPTDLAIGVSSTGEGESLFVTTTSLLKLFFGGRGNVVEIPHIRERIASK